MLYIFEKYLDLLWWFVLFFLLLLPCLVQIMAFVREVPREILTQIIAHMEVGYQTKELTDVGD